MDHRPEAPAGLKPQQGPQAGNPVVVEAEDFVWTEHAVLLRNTSIGSQELVAGFARESVVSIRKKEEAT